jgi:hypothetical protein
MLPLTPKDTSAKMMSSTADRWIAHDLLPFELRPPRIPEEIERVWLDEIWVSRDGMSQAQSVSPQCTCGQTTSCQFCC